MVPSDSTLAMAELFGDLIFGKIPSEQYRYYINASLDAGKKAAAQYAGNTMQQLYQQFGVTFEMQEKAPRYGGINLRAKTVTENGNTTVYVYRDSIQNLVKNSAWEGEKSLDFDTALNTHLYHELFHVLEEKKHAYVSDLLDCVTTWKFFSFSGHSHVIRCSEIAAHSFAKEMLGLPWLPNFYDYIYLKNKNQWSESQFTDFFSRMHALAE